MLATVCALIAARPACGVGSTDRQLGRHVASIDERIRYAALDGDDYRQDRLDAPSAFGVVPIGDQIGWVTQL